MAGHKGVLVLGIILSLWSVQGEEPKLHEYLCPILDKVVSKPHVPIFAIDSPVFLHVPSKLLHPTFRDTTEHLVSHFAKEEKRLGFVSQDVSIDADNIRRKDFEVPELKGYESFSPFVPYHQKLLQRVVTALLATKNVEDFVAALIFCRENLNKGLFSYAASLAIIHHENKELSRCDLLGHLQRSPYKFLDKTVFPRIKLQGYKTNEDRDDIVVPRNFTANNLEPEQVVAYFREDIGINIFHANWHTLYPPFDINSPNTARRGELFYYVHRQIIARYNMERMSNNMARVVRLHDLRESIPEGYFPKLTTENAARLWPARMAHSRLRDLARNDLYMRVDIQDLERWRERILSSIHEGSAKLPNGSYISLQDNNGIDKLGNIIEASHLSVNFKFYGNMHNMGHNLISFIHDPDNRYQESASVMGDITTSMRDPVFYRWHSFIDDIFQRHKDTLPSYTTKELEFKDVSLSVLVKAHKNSVKWNTLHTFWEKTTVDISKGLDLERGGQVNITFTHLNHVPFFFRIAINNTGRPRQATVRIFMAPQLDERNLNLKMIDQAHLFIELDRFEVYLNTTNKIFIRNSTDSTVTIPKHRIFKDQSLKSDDSTDEVDYCDCGWPDYMLIPKGSAEGFKADLFVIITDSKEDKVSENPCGRGHIFCGIQNKQYSHARPMGFPFDRVPDVEDLNEFMLSNMAKTSVTIYHDNREP